MDALPVLIFTGTLSHQTIYLRLFYVPIEVELHLFQDCIAKTLPSPSLRSFVILGNQIKFYLEIFHWCSTVIMSLAS